MTQQGYISIFGASLVRPIADLLEKVFSYPHPGSNPVQTGTRENGYAISSCLLLAVFLESFIRRATHLSGNSLKPAEKKHALEFLKKRYPSFGLFPAVTEIFVLRDVIAHNHLWRMEYSTDQRTWKDLLSKELDSASGDSKFNDSVDLQSGTTMVLGLKVIPTRIDRSEVRKVLDTVLDTLKFIDEKENNQLGLTGLRADFMNKQDLTLWEIRDYLKDHV
jgi:hypothetical protein